MITDELRMRFIMQDLDSYFKVPKDRWDYAEDVAEENGRNLSEDYTEEEQLEGFRRMIDQAMLVYGFLNIKGK